MKEDGKFIVGYFGGHAMSNALGFLIDAAQIINQQNENIHFVLVGSGVEKDKLIERTQNEKISNVTFLPPVSKKEIPNLTEMFDCIYMGTYKNNLYRFGMCLNKMIDSMMAAKPLVCSITAPPTWAEQCQCGIIIESEDVKMIVEAIYTLYEKSYEERCEMGQRGKGYAEQNFDVSILATKVIEIIRY